MDDLVDRLSLHCDQCKHDGILQDSMAWCVDCRKHYCAECTLEIKVKRHKHPFLSTMKYREFLINSYFGSFENCYVHSDVPTKYYCLKHQTTCCEKCRRQVHASCQGVVKPWQEAINVRTGVEFPDLQQRLKDAILSFESLIDENFENRKKLDVLKNKVVNDIFRMREDIDLQLERIQSELLDQLDKSYDQQIRILDNIVRYMEDIKEEVNQLKVDTDIVGNKLSDLELYFFIKAAQKHHLVTEKAIHELKKTSLDIKIKHDIDLGLRDLTQIHKQLLKIQVKGENISNIKLEEKKQQREKKQKNELQSVSDEDLSLPLGRDTPSTINYLSPRENIYTNQSTYRSNLRSSTPSFAITQRQSNENDSIDQLTFRSTSRVSGSVHRSLDLGRNSQLSFKSQRSPREYEQYLSKIKSGRLGQIKEIEQPADDEEPGAKTNIKNEIFSLQLKFQLPRRNKSPFVTDVKAVGSRRFIAADYNNKCIMLYDLHGTLMKESILNDPPQCLSVMKANEIAVTSPRSKIISIADITSLQTIRHVTAPHECEGITYSENRLIVNCNHEGIFVLSKTGKVLSKFPKLTGSMYLGMSNDHKLVCSVGVSGTLLGMSLEGREVFRFKHETLKRPSGVTSDQYGNIYIATWSNSYILQVKDNGKTQFIALDADDQVISPWGIDYDNATDIMLVSTDNGESIAIFKRLANR